MGRCAENRAGESVNDPEFPCEYQAGLRWREFCSRGAALDCENLVTLLALDAEGRNLVRQDADRYVSIWIAVNQMAKTSPSLREIRRYQEAEARELLGERGVRDRWSRAMRLYRQCPWAGRAHRELLDIAETALRKGHSGLALRCYTDVTARTDENELFSHSRVGTWIALAQKAENRGFLEASLRRVASDETLPFLGQMVRAEDIIRRILPEFGTGLPRRPVERESVPSTWPRKHLPFPKAKPWIVEFHEGCPPALKAAYAACIQPVSKHGKILLAGSNLLACFSENLQEPIWIHRSSVSLRFEKEDFTAPAPFVPHVEEDRVYTRWGIENTGGLDFFPRIIKHVVALDISNGKPVWTTRQTAGWEELSPVSDPVLTDGRVYVLAVESAHPALAAPFFVASLDAATGNLLWKRHLVTSSMSVRGRRGTLDERAVNVTRFGGSLALVRGAVYCQTNAGAFARCDARDGLIEWALGYTRDAGTMDPASILCREGGRPVIIDDVALFLPRDSAFLYAVSIEGGDLAWKTYQRESRWLLGQCGTRALLAGDRCLVAVESASGTVAWERKFQPLLGQPQLLKGVVYVGTADALFAVDGERGELLREWSWEGTSPLHFVIEEGNLVMVRRLSALRGH